VSDYYEPIEQPAVRAVQWVPGQGGAQVKKMIDWLIEMDMTYVLTVGDDCVIIALPGMPDLYPGEWLYRENALAKPQIATDAWFKGKYRKAES